MEAFIGRLLGALRLNAATFEEIEATPAALPQAVGVVLAASVAAGVGLAPALSLSTMLITAAAWLIGWLSWASLVNYLGGGLFPDAETRVDVGQLARTIGFSAAPGLLLWVVALPWLRPWTLGLIAAWMLAAMIVAVRQALDFRSWGRALAICTAAAALTLVAAFVIALAWAPRVS